MRNFINWLCFQTVLAWPYRLQYGIAESLFFRVLARAGEYANKPEPPSPSNIELRGPDYYSATQRTESDGTQAGTRHFVDVYDRRYPDGEIGAILQHAEEFIADRVGRGESPLSEALRGRFGCAQPAQTGHPLPGRSGPQTPDPDPAGSPA